MPENKQEWGVVRVRPDLHKRLRLWAVENDTQMAEVVGKLLERFFAQEARKRQKQEAAA
jgi:hypothetical protein